MPRLKLHSSRVFRTIAALLIAVGISSAYGTEIVSGRFELIDHHGETVSEANYDGRFRLVFFGFTRCPVICPTTMIEVSRAMNALGDRVIRVQPLFITIDPGNDTVDVVASYVGHFHPSVVGLTGSSQQIAAAAKSFNVTFGGTGEGAVDRGDEIYHSSYLYLMDEDGKLLDVFGYGDKAETILETLEPYLSASDSKLEIVDPWASEPAGANANVIAGFMCFRNNGSSSTRIVGASSEAVERVEIHEIIHEQGIVRMRKINGVDVSARAHVCLEPQQRHFMLIGISDSVRSGADIRLRIDTASGEELSAVLPQRKLGGTD